MRFNKIFMGLTLLSMMIPALSVSAATGAYTSSITSSSLTLGWTLQSGEGYVNVYKNGVYYNSMAGNSISVTGLAACTTYAFNVVSGTSGYASTSTNATTLGCDPTPSAPSISYTSSSSAVNLTWTSSNATSYDVYKDSVLLDNTTNSYYSFYSAPSQYSTVKVVAKNNTGQTAFSTLNVNTLAFSNSWTSNLNAGNIRVGAAFSNSSSSSWTTMNFTLYRVTGSGDVYAGSNSVNIAPSASVGGWYNLALSQPAGYYKVVLTSTYATTSGVSLVNY